MNTTREPVLTPAAVTAAVTAVIALIVAFGVDLTPEQTAGILGVTAVIANLLAAYLGRNRVTPLADPRDEDGNRLAPIP